MPNFSFQLEGLALLKGRIDSAAQNLPQNLGKALYQFGEEVMAISKERVPVDTGALMNSGYVSLPKQEGNLITVELGYGGPSVDYALAVHEDLDPKRHWHRPGSGPKYLEGPLIEKQGDLALPAGDAVKLSFAA